MDNRCTATGVETQAVLLNSKSPDLEGPDKEINYGSEGRGFKSSWAHHFPFSLNDFEGFQVPSSGFEPVENLLKSPVKFTRSDGAQD